MYSADHAGVEFHASVNDALPKGGCGRMKLGEDGKAVFWKRAVHHQAICFAREHLII